MRSLLALQIPEHVVAAGGVGSGYHLAHHHVPIDGGTAAAVGNEYMETELDLDNKKREKLRQPPTMWSRPKMVGINTNKSSLKKPIPKGGGLGTDFSIAV